MADVCPGCHTVVSPHDGEKQQIDNKVFHAPCARKHRQYLAHLHHPSVLREGKPRQQSFRFLN